MSSNPPLATAVPAKRILSGVTNVDRADGKPFGNDFDWLSAFKTEKYAFVPEPIAAHADIRAAMIRLLRTTPLAGEIFAKISAPTGSDRAERLAWILPDGFLGRVQKGSRESVPIPAPPGRAVGLVHSHPIVHWVERKEFHIQPPSHARGDDDYDDESLRKFPMQFVAESNSGRLWGQFRGGRTSILGRVSPPAGRLEFVDVSDPTAAVVYVTVPLDIWNERQKDRKR